MHLESRQWYQPINFPKMKYISTYAMKMHFFHLSSFSIGKLNSECIIFNKQININIIALPLMCVCSNFEYTGFQLMKMKNKNWSQKKKTTMDSEHTSIPAKCFDD